MINFEKLLIAGKSITLYKNLKTELTPLFNMLRLPEAYSLADNAAQLYYDALACGCFSLGEYIEMLIKRDENPFSQLCAKGLNNAMIFEQAARELNIFKELTSLSLDDFSSYDTALLPFLKKGKFKLSVAELKDFHIKNGCGVFSTGAAFKFENGQIVAAQVKEIKLEDLKNYSQQKQAVVRNTEDFLASRPAFNVLFYGDGGTGKSSTVHALINAYAHMGLKLIELKKNELDFIGQIFLKIADYKQKFIIFLDDISFEQNDYAFWQLKTALEGALSKNGALVYATTNRRHGVNETNYENARYQSDAMAHNKALADRFGLTVTYLNPQKAEYLEILKKILADRGIEFSSEYEALAERFALSKGARTPRAAKQAADIIEAQLLRSIKGI